MLTTVVSLVVAVGVILAGNSGKQPPGQTKPNPTTTTIAAPSTTVRAPTTTTTVPAATTTTTVPAPTTTTTVPSGAYEVPGTIAADCSKDVSADLNNFLAKVPNGATVNFPSGGCYSQSQSILLRGRANLTIEGRGSTFRSSAPNDNSKLVPNWFLLRSRGITLRNLTAIGNFHDPGPPNPNRGAVTSNAGVSIYGGSDITVQDVNIRHVFGDGVTIADAWSQDAQDTTHEYPRNVRLTRISVEKAARHCLVPAEVIGFWLTDSTLTDCYLHGVDAEKDLATSPLHDLHFVNNTISNYFSMGIVFPTGGLSGNPVDGIELRGNRFRTLPIAAPCNPPVLIGAYADQYFSNVTIADNEILSWKVAIQGANVLSGRIVDNVITHPEDARVNDCGPDYEANVVMHNSPNVVVANNG